VDKCSAVREVKLSLLVDPERHTHSLQAYDLPPNATPNQVQHSQRSLKFRRIPDQSPTLPDESKFVKNWPGGPMWLCTDAGSTGSSAGSVPFPYWKCERPIGGRGSTWCRCAFSFSFFFYYLTNKCCFGCQRWRISRQLGPCISRNLTITQDLHLWGRTNFQWTCHPDDGAARAQAPGCQRSSCRSVQRGRGGGRCNQRRS